MIGMRVGFEDPIDVKTCLAYIADEFVSGFKTSTTRRLIEIPDAVDDGRALGLIVADDIGRGKGRLMEERFDVRRSRIARKVASISAG